MSQNAGNEQQIIAKLRKGLEQSDPVPGLVSEFASALFTWRNVDAELAELSFDSIDENTPSGVRSTTTARMVSFQAGQWLVDVEHDPTTGILMGVVSPDSDFTVELHSRGAHFLVASDEGRFEFEDVEAGPISLVFRFSDGQTVKTNWIFL